MQHKLCAIMDESDAPYTEEEFNRTTEDDIVLLELMRKDGTRPERDSRLYKVGKEIGYIKQRDRNKMRLRRL